MAVAAEWRDSGIAKNFEKLSHCVFLLLNRQNRINFTSVYQLLQR